MNNALAAASSEALPELSEMGTFKGVSIDKCESVADIYKLLRATSTSAPHLVSPSANYKYGSNTKLMPQGSPSMKVGFNINSPSDSNMGG